MITRLAYREVAEALEDTPVVLIHGPRQCGKSTLAKSFDLRPRRYITFDNPLHLEQATLNPAGFLADFDGPLILDEIQRVPKLFLPLKMRVDENRMPGKYLLTGSANVLLLPKVADSLAGRMAIIDLLPFSQSELEGTPSNFVDRLFDLDLPDTLPLDQDDLILRVVVGGFPEPNTRRAATARDRWFQDYIRSIIERDVRDLANIDALAQMPRVLRLLASRSGSTLNVSSLSRDTGIPNTSLHRYLELLQATFLVQEFPTWSNNRGVRVARTPKTFLVDTGVVCYLNNLGASSFERDRDRFESVLTTFVAMELKKLARYSLKRPEIHHLRTVSQWEVDFVLETNGGDVVGIQVSGASAVDNSEIRGLSHLIELAPDNFKVGVVLYCGSKVEQLAGGIWAVPISALWS